MYVVHKNTDSDRFEGAATKVTGWGSSIKDKWHLNSES